MCLSVVCYQLTTFGFSLLHLPAFEMAASWAVSVVLWPIESRSFGRTDAPQIYAAFRLGILSYDVATYLYFFRLGDHVCSLKHGVSPCFSSYQTMVTSCVHTVEDRCVKEDVGHIPHHVINLVLFCLIWTDPCPSSVWLLLEKGGYDLKICAVQQNPLAYCLSCFLFLYHTSKYVYVSLISPEGTLALKPSITTLQCALLFIMMSNFSFSFSISSSG